MEEQNKTYPTFKSQVALPMLFILSITVLIFILTVDGFASNIKPAFIWAYFAVTLIYVIISIADVITNKERSKKQKIWIIVFSILSVIAVALLLVFFMLNK